MLPNGTVFGATSVRTFILVALIIELARTTLRLDWHSKIVYVTNRK